MRVKVLLFGAESRVVDNDHLMVEFAGKTCGELRRALGRVEPRLADCRLAVNHEYAEDDKPILAGDEVELIGRVSGG